MVVLSQSTMSGPVRAGKFAAGVDFDGICWEVSHCGPVPAKLTHMKAKPGIQFEMNSGLKRRQTGTIVAVRRFLLFVAATAGLAGFAQPVQRDPLAAATWTEHLNQDLLPFWSHPDALGSNGDFPAIRCDDGSGVNWHAPAVKPVATPGLHSGHETWWPNRARFTRTVSPFI